MKFYRNKKIKLNALFFSFFIVNWMEMNTKNKVLSEEKEKYGG